MRERMIEGLDLFLDQRSSFTETHRRVGEREEVRGLPGTTPCRSIVRPPCSLVSAAPPPSPTNFPAC